MKYNGEFDIAIGHGVSSKIWKNHVWTWSHLVSRLYEENKTSETFQEYHNATKVDKLKIKDVGGYVGAYLRTGRRTPKNVIHRQLITLDIDFGHAEFWEDFQMLFENAAVLHGTHSYTKEDPKFRLIMPLSREVSPDEYVAISRKVAGIIGIDYFDKTTFEVNRLMFWPSTPKDSDYYFRSQDGPWLDADEILGMYVDWRDSTQWPTSTEEESMVLGAVQKQENPLEKKGIIGAFCRAYTIDQAISEFLEDDYEPFGEDRYTYKKGSTAGGLIVYDNIFAYSHHGTDPCSGKLCNAYDLVRIHAFGHYDDKEKNGSKNRMDDFCRGNSQVKKLIAKENLESVKSDFSESFNAEEEDLDWTKDLEIDSRGKYLSTASNLNLIFEHDPNLREVFRENMFDMKRYIWRSLPWRKIERPDIMKNVDYSGVRNYIETVYGITGVTKIEDALSLEFEKHQFHPIRDYLQSLEWDGEERVDRLLIDFLGVEDSIYSREAIRKSLVGAVSRVFQPGCKFDLVLTIVGEQGTGKSTFVNKLGGPWFSDTFMTVHGKEALEQIQGAWIIEMAELSGLRKAEVEAIKHFISKQEDSFRPAYARTSETFKRQCIFIGTTNSESFLRDPSGNRRFIPVKVNLRNATKNVFKDLEDEVDQIWAEAYQIYLSGEKRYLTRVAQKMAVEEQLAYSETDDRTGLVENYLHVDLPKDWNQMDIYARRTYLEDPLSRKGEVEREYVCVAEVWAECLGKPVDQMSRYNTRDINDILKSIPGWDLAKGTRVFPIYGKQRYYQKSLL